MRKGMWSTAALVGLLSAAAAVLMGPGVRAADNKVSMTDDLTFEPKEITVPVGAVVTWHNDSSLQHDAKAKDGSFSSPMLDKGKEFSFTFKAPGDVKYNCTVPGHEGAGMSGIVHVGAATPTTAPTTPTTGSTATTTATTVPGQGTTTTTAAKNAAAASSTTTTTAAGGAGATTTTLAPSVTPTSAPETAGETSTTTPSGSGEAAEGGHASGGGSHDDDTTSPIGIVFAAVSTLLLGGIAGKLLLSKP